MPRQKKPKRPETIGWDYRPLVRISRLVPWGYDADPDDDKMMLPNLPMLKLLEKAEAAFWDKTSSHQQLAEWLSSKTGRPITRIGLKKRILDGNEKLRRER